MKMAALLLCYVSRRRRSGRPPVPVNRPAMAHPVSATTSPSNHGSGFGEPVPAGEGVAEAAIPGVPEAEPVGVVDAELAGFTADCAFCGAATLSAKLPASCDAIPAAVLSGKRWTMLS